jgi:hypothetical protein
MVATRNTPRPRPNCTPNARACVAPGRLGLQVAWLLLALHLDQPSNRHLALFREKVECAALDGRWVGGKRGGARGEGWGATRVLQPTWPCVDEGPCV